ncbi:MAG: murein hydrolase activator EnvC [Hyphomonadaceae bacterium]
MVYGALRAGVAAACAAALLASPPLANAQTRRANDAAAAERARAAAAGEARRAREGALAAQSEIAALDARLDAASTRQAEAAAEFETADARIGALETQLGIVRRRYAEERAGIEDAVIAALFAQRQALTRPRHAARTVVFVRAAGPALVSQATARAQEIAQAQHMHAALASARSDLIAAQAALEAEREGIALLIAARRSARSALIAEAQAAERLAARHAREARTLRELAQRVQTPRRQNAAARTRAPLGTLRTPVEGALVRAYDGAGSQGNTWRTAPGARVSAPANGRVGYAGLFRSYGQVLILNLDNGYVIVLAGMDSATVQTGEAVRAGQPVGIMSADASTAPELYVEVRQDGRPVDPSRSFASTQRGAVRRTG